MPKEKNWRQDNLLCALQSLSSLEAVFVFHAEIKRRQSIHHLAVKMFLGLCAFVVMEGGSLIYAAIPLMDGIVTFDPMDEMDIIVSRKK